MLSTQWSSVLLVHQVSRSPYTHQRTPGLVLLGRLRLLSALSVFLLDVRSLSSDASVLPAVKRDPVGPLPLFLGTAVSSDVGVGGVVTGSGVS